MQFNRWQPSESYTKQEKRILERTRKKRRLFAFLREHRLEIFDDAFQSELESMYRSTGAGRSALPPAMLAIAVVMQGYLGLSDADAVEMTVVDLRWQMVLGCLGAEETAFAQGTLYEFRERLIATDMDRRLLERTVEVARQTKAFDWKKLPTSLRVAMDSSPLEGEGRVEDTINLLAHAARNVVRCAAKLTERSVSEVALEAGIPLLLESSVKKGIDIEWSDPIAKGGAIGVLARQVAALEAWVADVLIDEMDRPPLRECLETLEQIRRQDLEPDPSGGGGSRIREGVAEDRRISIEDAEMRHGRKSKSKRFDGFKRHVATDLDTALIVACAVTPGNRHDSTATPALRDDIERQQFTIAALHVDRGYVTSPVVGDVLAARGEVFCKPWVARNGVLFSKADFGMNMRERTITCPAGQVALFELGSVVEFDPEVCGPCRLRSRCTVAGPKVGRTIKIAEDERLQQRMRKQVATSAGRQRLRERVAVEHTLAHISGRQGNKARYRGVRKNLFDLRRTATIQNLETIQRRLERALAA